MSSSIKGGIHYIRKNYIGLRRGQREYIRLFGIINKEVIPIVQAVTDSRDGVFHMDREIGARKRKTDRTSRPRRIRGCRVFPVKEPFIAKAGICGGDG